LREDRDRLFDMQEAIEAIERYAGRGREHYERDELVQVWMLHHVQVIGEAASRLSKALLDKHPEIAWPDIISMRNVLVHHYFGVDLDEVWDTVSRDVPTLKPAVERMLLESGEEE